MRRNQRDKKIEYVFFNRYISNYKRIVVPNIFENLLPKVANLLAFSLFAFINLPEKVSLGFFLGIFVLGLLGYIFYNNKLEKFTPDFSTDFIKKDKLWKEVLNYSFFGFLGNLGSFLSLNISIANISIR